MPPSRPPAPSPPPNAEAGPSSNPIPPSESIPYITVPQQFVSLDGDELAFPNPDAYARWLSDPRERIDPSPRPTRVRGGHVPPIPHVNPAFLPGGDMRGIGSYRPPRQPQNFRGRGASPNPGMPSHGWNGPAYSAPARAFHTTRSTSDGPRPVDSYRPPSLSKAAYTPPGAVKKLWDAPVDAVADSNDPSTSSRSSYVPPHQRGPPAPPTDSMLPPKEYLRLSRPDQKTRSPIDVPKLLVLDLNGAIIYRTARSSTHRHSYPRPYLSNLLDYLFLPDPPEVTEDGDGDDRSFSPPWSVFVWSSAQPHNVRSMVEMGFGDKYTEGVWQHETLPERTERMQKGEGRLLGVWARDKMGLKPNDYKNKVQTYKDLRLVSSHLSENKAGRKDLPAEGFDEKTTVLLDDSPLKARYQPWNQLVIPEYGKAEFAASRSAASRSMRKNDDLTPDGMDCTLLAIIGILEELRTISNVPAWIRGGGLTRISTTTLDTDDESSVDDILNEYDEPALTDLPSHESFVHWYNKPNVVDYWTKKGKRALQLKGIKVGHGIDPSGSRSPSPGPASADRLGWDDRQSQSPLPARQRAWSPSRPVGMSPPPPDGQRGIERSPGPGGFYNWNDRGGRNRRGFATTTNPDEITLDIDESASEAADMMQDSLSISDGNAVGQTAGDASLPQISSSSARPSNARTAPPSSTDYPVRPVTVPATSVIIPRNRNPNGANKGSVDRWRTFSALEVSQYLYDIADRSVGSSFPPFEQDRQSLHQVAEALARYGQDVEVRRPSSRAWDGDLCEECTMKKGLAEGEALSAQLRDVAMAEGLPPKPAFNFRERLKDERLAAKAKKKIDKAERGGGGQPKGKGKKAAKRAKAAAAAEQAAKKDSKKSSGKKKKGSNATQVVAGAVAAIVAGGSVAPENSAGLSTRTSTSAPSEASVSNNEAKKARRKARKVAAQEMAEKAHEKNENKKESKKESKKEKRAKDEEGNKGKAKTKEKSEGKNKEKLKVDDTDEAFVPPDITPSTPTRSTPRRQVTMKREQADELPSPRRSNPRRQATNHEAIKTEAELEAAYASASASSAAARRRSHSASASPTKVKRVSGPGTRGKGAGALELQVEA